MICSFYSPRLELYIYAVMESSRIKKVGFSKSPVGGGSAGQIIDELKRYLNGKKVDFQGYALDLSGLTTFEKSVLIWTRKIPYGTTISYSELASRAGRKAARAAGNALARNPIPLIIPCHRVLRKNRELGGYSAGAGIKKKLLEIEGIRF